MGAAARRDAFCAARLAAAATSSAGVMPTSDAPRTAKGWSGEVGTDGGSEKQKGAAGKGGAGRSSCSWAARSPAAATGMGMPAATGMGKAIWRAFMLVMVAAHSGPRPPRPCPPRPCPPMPWPPLRLRAKIVVGIDVGIEVGIEIGIEVCIEASIEVGIDEIGGIDMAVGARPTGEGSFEGGRDVPLNASVDPCRAPNIGCTAPAIPGAWA